MFILLFVLWILFNGKITLEICLFGLGISAAVYWFAVKMLDYDPKAELRALKKPDGSCIFWRFCSGIFSKPAFM